MSSHDKSRAAVRQHPLKSSRGMGAQSRNGGRIAEASATKVKNEFGRWLEKAIRGEVVVITKHDSPKAVLLSVDEYQALARAPEARIENLRAEFDALLDRMQTPRVRRAMRAAFRASPKDLAKTAVAAASKRG